MSLLKNIKNISGSDIFRYMKENEENKKLLKDKANELQHRISDMRNLLKIEKDKVSLERKQINLKLKEIKQREEQSKDFKEILKIEKANLELKKKEIYERKHSRKITQEHQKIITQQDNTAKTMVQKVKNPKKETSMLSKIGTGLLTGYLIKQFYPMFKKFILPEIKKYLPSKEQMKEWYDKNIGTKIQEFKQYLIDKIGSIDTLKTLMKGVGLIAFLKNPIKFITLPIKASLKVGGFLFSTLASFGKKLLSTVFGGILGNELSGMGGKSGKGGKVSKIKGFKGALKVLGRLAKFIPFVGSILLMFDAFEEFFPNVTKKISDGLNKVGDWLTEKLGNMFKYIEEKIRQIPSVGNSIADSLFGKKSDKKPKPKSEHQHTLPKKSNKVILSELEEKYSNIKKQYKEGKITKNQYNGYKTLYETNIKRYKEVVKTEKVVIPSNKPNKISSKKQTQTKVPNKTGLSNKTRDNLLNIIGQRESSNDYTAVNNLGYLGRYQLGAKALIDVGLVKKGTTNKGLNNPSNWILNGGKNTFLSSPSIQDEAMKKLLNLNAKYMGKDLTGTEQQKAGLLTASHLLGAGKAKKGFGSDANGTTFSEYFNMGSKAVNYNSSNTTSIPKGSLNSILSSAKEDLGVREIKGKADNPKIRAYHASTRGGEASDEVPWCSAFVNYHIKKAGFKGTNSKAAKSWKTWGLPIPFPKPGCVAVKVRKGGNHVGIVAWVDAKKGALGLLGGNQGKFGEVKVSTYPISVFTDFRVPGPKEGASDGVSVPSSFTDGLLTNYNTLKDNITSSINNFNIKDMGKNLKDGIDKVDRYTFSLFKSFVTNNGLVDNEGNLSFSNYGIESSNSKKRKSSINPILFKHKQNSIIKDIKEKRNKHIGIDTETKKYIKKDKVNDLFDKPLQTINNIITQGTQQIKKGIVSLEEADYKDFELGFLTHIF